MYMRHAKCAPSLREDTCGAWLWSRRRGVITGRAAAALHGALWVDDDYTRSSCCGPTIIRRRASSPAATESMTTRSSRFIGMPVATLPRTAFDLGRYPASRRRRRSPRRACLRYWRRQPKTSLPLGDRYKGARGVRAFSGGHRPHGRRWRSPLRRRGCDCCSSTPDFRVRRPRSRFDDRDVRVLIPRHGLGGRHDRLSNTTANSIESIRRQYAWDIADARECSQRRSWIIITCDQRRPRPPTSSHRVRDA